MTLKDIAKEAGVSASTVSRVINNKGGKAASKDTQDRIWKIVRKNNYIPNPLAQNLKKGEGKHQNLEPTRFIDCLYARTDATAADPFFSSLERAIEQVALNYNYVVKHSYSLMDIQSPSLLSIFQDDNIEGIVILGRGGFTKQQLQFLNHSYKNIAYVGLNALNLKCDQIICSAYEASVAAIDYLYELGHRNIGYIGEQKDEERFLGYKDALQKHGLPFSIKKTAHIHHSSDGGYRGVQMLIQRGCEMSAVFCANDITAVGAIKAFHEVKKNVPKEISIISIDDINLAQYITPMLTTVHIPIEELGNLTVKILIDRIHGGHRLPVKILLPFYIAKRDSCAKLKR